MSKELKIVKTPGRISFLSYISDRQGCGHIRVIFPAMLMNMLRLPDYIFEHDYGMVFCNDIKYFIHYSMVIFQRAATDRHLELIKHYKTNLKPIARVPMVYEIDDLLTDIPLWNYASTYYNSRFNVTSEIMKLVDGISVSTEKLKEIYSQFNNNIVVIPNHLPKFLWGNIIKKHETTPNIIKPRILYAGSENHFCNKKSDEYKKGLISDGGDFGLEFLDYIKKTTDKYQWVFSGAYPLELENLINDGKIEKYPWKNILEYPRHIKSLDIDIWLAPLQKCLFNDSKSNIKGLEAVASGCPCVFSNAEPYKNFMLTCNSDNEIISYIEKLAVDIDFRKKVYEHDYNVVKELLFWEEYDNVKKYVNSYISLFGKILKDDR